MSVLRREVVDESGGGGGVRRVKWSPSRTGGVAVIKLLSCDKLYNRGSGSEDMSVWRLLACEDRSGRVS